ncbi:hypothetical protein Pelo_4230 [Pelomyxa schiedti]|nr:hypothetical protein Pelo_4230 [Pelomyxa schiedti]
MSMYSVSALVGTLPKCCMHDLLHFCTKMLSPIAGSFLSWYYTFPNVYLVSVRCSCFLQTPQCLLHQIEVRIGLPEKFPHVHIVSAPAHSILFLPGLSLHGVGIHLRQASKKSEVVLLQVRALLISTSEFSIWLPESWQLQPNQGSIVVLGGQMDLIAFGRLSSSQFALGSLALSHNLGACNISCLSYCLFGGLRSKMTG